MKIGDLTFQRMTSGNVRISVRDEVHLITQTEFRAVIAAMTQVQETRSITGVCRFVMPGNKVCGKPVHVDGLLTCTDHHGMLQHSPFACGMAGCGVMVEHKHVAGSCG